MKYIALGNVIIPAHVRDMYVFDTKQEQIIKGALADPLKIDSWRRTFPFKQVTVRAFVGVLDDNEKFSVSRVIPETYYYGILNDNDEPIIQHIVRKFKHGTEEHNHHENFSKVVGVCRLYSNMGALEEDCVVVDLRSRSLELGSVEYKSIDEYLKEAAACDNSGVQLAFEQDIGFIDTLHMSLSTLRNRHNGVVDETTTIDGLSIDDEIKKFIALETKQCNEFLWSDDLAEQRNIQTPITDFLNNYYYEATHVSTNIFDPKN